MDVIYGLIPMMLIFGFLVVVVFIWMAKSGQFDDLDGAANRIFMDDDFPDPSHLADGRESLQNSAQKTQQAGLDAHTAEKEGCGSETDSKAVDKDAPETR